MNQKEKGIGKDIKTEADKLRLCPPETEQHAVTQEAPAGAS